MENHNPTATTQNLIPIASLNDRTSPFYIHPLDSPGMLLVNSLFDGNGYAGWSRDLVIASAKNKLGLIDGTIEIPHVSDPKFRARNRCNDMIISWILNSLSKDIATLFCTPKLLEKYGKN